MARCEVTRGKAMAALTVLLLGVTVVAGSAAAADSVESQVRATINGALERQRTGATVRWSDAGSGRAGQVTIDRTFYRSDGTPCRDYTVTEERRGGGKRSSVSGTGCRTGPGVWSLSAVMPAARPPAPASSARSERSAAAAPPRKTAKASPAAPASAAPASSAGVSGFRPEPADRKPVVIAASLPTRSDE